ncbi:MAG TPA: hypothetical protein VJ464_25910 [Blastocatellia bacterium]|nr:hypothetical protein [Blastocatellia bacterium]
MLIPAWLALKLFAGRYEVIAMRDAADILRETTEKHMPERAASEEDETQADE